MKAMPKRVKYRKSRRGRIRTDACRGNKVNFGEYGLLALERALLSAKQLEACRVVAAHLMGKEGRLYIRVFPHKSVSAKPAETRMGKGKGEPEYYAAVVKTGTVLFELGALTQDMAKVVLNAMAHKLPIRVKMVYRRHAI